MACSYCMAPITRVDRRAQKYCSKTCQNAARWDRERACCTVCGNAKGPGIARSICDSCWDATEVDPCTHPDEPQARGCCMTCYRRRWTSLRPYRNESRFTPTDESRQRYRLAAARARMVSRYGITTDDYADMARNQGGVCAICGGLPTKGVLSIDHDHDSGRVRALLCDQCNFVLGLAKESPTILRIAAEYLECA